MELRLPLEQIRVTQPWGMNYVNFYKKMGLKGHNGIDFSAKTGTDCHASHNGEVTWAGEDGGGGISVTLTDKVNHFKTIYYHLLDVTCKKGDIKKAGDIIGHCDNTGKYTTGSHLHFGMKMLDKDNFNTINYNNGYKGAINPSRYFVMAYNGFKIGAKDYDKSRCYQRYYRTAKRNLANEMKVALYMAYRLKRLPNNEEINAAVWGGWDMEAIENPALYAVWSQLKKTEFQKGKRLNTQGM
jgi:hypothetical protein